MNLCVTHATCNKLTTYVRVDFLKKRATEVIHVKTFLLQNRIARFSINYSFINKAVNVQLTRGMPGASHLRLNGVCNNQYFLLESRKTAVSACPNEPTASRPSLIRLERLKNKQDNCTDALTSCYFYT